MSALVGGPVDGLGAGLAGLGWDAAWQAAFGPMADGLVPARVVGAHRGTWEVALGGPDGPLEARATGRLRHEAGPAELPVVGDWVAVDARPEEAAASVHVVLPRRTQLRRKAPADYGAPFQVLAANVDVVLVATSLNRDLNARRVERFLTAAWESGARPVVVLTKVDLARDPVEVAVAEAPARGGGGRRAGRRHERRERRRPRRRPRLPGRRTDRRPRRVVGRREEHPRQRPAGRGAAPRREIREDDARGRHTTVGRQLVALPGGEGLLLDTPGLRELGLWDDGTGLDLAFADVAAAAESCRFSDCRHQTEPGCASGRPWPTGPCTPIVSTAGASSSARSATGRSRWTPWHAAPSSGDGPPSAGRVPPVRRQSAGSGADERGVDDADQPTRRPRPVRGCRLRAPPSLGRPPHGGTSGAHRVAAGSSRAAGRSPAPVGYRGSWPSRATSSSQGRSAIVVARPWPGRTRRASGSWPAGPGTRPSRRDRRRAGPPSPTRPGTACRRRRRRRPRGNEADRALGVAGRVEHVEADIAEADPAALGELDGRNAGRDRERGEEGLRVGDPVPVGAMGRDLGAARAVAAVLAAVGGDDVSRDGRPASPRRASRQGLGPCRLGAAVRRTPSTMPGGRRSPRCGPSARASTR